jgi:hypothetical protein
MGRGGKGGGYGDRDHDRKGGRGGMGRGGKGGGYGDRDHDRNGGGYGDQAPL